jgi:excisionase family DNA binding protein
MNDQLRLLTRKDVTRLFQLPASTLDYLVACGEIPYFRVSRRNVRFRESELKEWLESRRDLPYSRGTP